MKTLSTLSFQRIALVLSLIVGLAVGATSGIAEAAPPSDVGPTAVSEGAGLTVMSFNIAHGRGVDGLVDLERVARQIDASGATVVGLQEVDQRFSSRSSYVAQADWLAERLGMSVVFGGNVTSATGQYGTAVLSAHPILATTNTPLPDFGTEQRGLLEATIDVDGRTIRVLNTHLTNVSSAERVAQASVVAEAAVAGAGSVVLLGDFNSGPRTGELVAIQDILGDAWTMSGRGKGATYPAARPRSRIDYVFVSPDLAVSAAETPGSSVSDHLPVIATLGI